MDYFNHCHFDSNENHENLKMLFIQYFKKLARNL
ncbi:transcriptional regulator [Klebsiella quasipneumoniae]|nr:transcriptional regulator [Klebsiella quasipneumoniae]TXV68149.1 transcriptional regulator [Klebsiella quasipneumoniae]TXW57498.1 transcriptional regulator [Klebsiella quasipneumoniae]TXW81269.1 transcriptional regulator [Klebsiella quasipneumoniae]